MFNVCGVTFDHTTNYGSCFQAYALQTAIEAMTIQGEKCHYDLLPTAILMAEKQSQKSSGENNFISSIKKKILASLHKERRKHFAEFENKYMHFADCKRMQELPSLNEQYDAFVCGSDVVWNVNYTQGESMYFLDFADKYKFSYAASFGVMDIDRDYNSLSNGKSAREIFQTYLPKLNQISVRESGAVDTAQKLSGKPVVHVCDPVLLLSPEHWDKLAGKAKGKKHYIFAYSTYVNTKYMAFLKQLRKETGLPIIHVTWDFKAALTNGLLFGPRPEKWLQLMRDADYVVTNSFHGVVFCTLFHKTFWFPLRDDIINGSGIRLFDFLHLCGLDERMVIGAPPHIDLSPLDYSKTDERIRQFREKSIEFLKTNLQVAQEKR